IIRIAVHGAIAGMEPSATPRARREGPSDAGRRRCAGFIQSPRPAVLLSRNGYSAATGPRDGWSCGPIRIVVRGERNGLVFPNHGARVQVQAQHAETIIGTWLRLAVEARVACSDQKALEGRRRTPHAAAPRASRLKTESGLQVSSGQVHGPDLPFLNRVVAVVAYSNVNSSEPDQRRRVTDLLM